jgi:hypothetical protein
MLMDVLTATDPLDQSTTETTQRKRTLVHRISGTIAEGIADHAFTRKCRAEQDSLVTPM